MQIVVIKGLIGTASVINNIKKLNTLDMTYCLMLILAIFVSKRAYLSTANS